MPELRDRTKDNICGKTASLQESVLEAILNELQSLLVTLLGVNSNE